MHKKYLITGGKNLSGNITISGSKNVATKAVIAACLTDEPVVLKNVPKISDIEALLEVIQSIGGSVKRVGHTITIQVKEIKNNHISLAEGARVRTSSMFMAPLLHRTGMAIVPNPEGCRLGARPIDRHIEGLEQMGAKIIYKSEDGYYHAAADVLTGTKYTFIKNTHTGTETMILAAVLANGTTIIENAAEEHEIDDLILLLQKMGAKIERTSRRIIKIEGVSKLHGATHEIVSDGNELVTFAVLSILTGGNIWLKNANLDTISMFLEQLKLAGCYYELRDDSIRFFKKDEISPTKIQTAIEPGFKTDWHGAWAILMTQASGESQVHETIYENRFGYVSELKKMGAKISYYTPEVKNPEEFYNFNYEKNQTYQQAIHITGPQKLHNAVLNVTDLRAGATLVIAAIIASGESVIFGVEHIERGYEGLDSRLKSLGVSINVIEEE